MVRNRKRKSLYEVIGGASSNSSYDKRLDMAHPSTAADGSEGSTHQTPVKWPTRPRAVQLNAGRIEISISYQLAVAIVLGVVLLALVLFHLGRVSSVTNEQSAQQQGEKQKTVTAEPTKSSAVLRPVKTQPPQQIESEPIVYSGNNRIVIQTYQIKADLVPVQQYFRNNGIETEIRKIVNWYYLVTKAKFDNPDRPGTDGYQMKNKIIELGKKYKAPAGFGSFGPKPFHDAYGKRFDD
jgi:hypothetical protein